MWGANKGIEALFKQGLRVNPLSVLITAAASANARLVAVKRTGMPFVSKSAFIARCTDKERIAAEGSADGRRSSR